jgi:arabinogalactan endo-1,4-beta-galactosidase
VDYEVLGISAYPFWTEMSIAGLANFASWVRTTSGKPVMVAEIGYPWTLEAAFAGETTTIQDNHLDADGIENYGATPAGQLRYMQEYMRAMNDVARAEAISYWDPISVDPGPGADPNGWVVGGDFATEDTSFFDYSSQHKALPSLQAFNTW